jgi:hypothetical protein
MGRIASADPRMRGLVAWVHPGSGGRLRWGVVATIEMCAGRSCEACMGGPRSSKGMGVCRCWLGFLYGLLAMGMMVGMGWF